MESSHHDGRSVYRPDISSTKEREFFGGPFGVNRSRHKTDQLPVRPEILYEAFGYYFHWANSLEGANERERAIKEGEFALQDLQTQGHTVVNEGTANHEYYAGLATRRGRIDTVEIRRKVFGKIKAIVVAFVDSGDLPQ